MADWPDVEELGRVLDINTDPNDWAVTLDRILAAAIARVKLDVGRWDELTDEPNDALAQAALRMGELIAEREGSTSGLVGVRQSYVLSVDPTYQRLMFGNRKRFAIS